MENKEIVCKSLKYAFKYTFVIIFGIIALFTLTFLLVTILETIGLNRTAIFTVSLIIMLFTTLLITFFGITYVDYKNGRK